MRRPGPGGQKNKESFGSSSVQALLEVTSVVRGERDLKSALATIVTTVAEALEFKTVVLNLYRPEFDDFCSGAPMNGPAGGSCSRTSTAAAAPI